MNVFYLPEIRPGGVILSEEESGHAIRVLRLQEKERIILVDGCGKMAEALIVTADPRKCRIEIFSVTDQYEKRPYRLHLAVAPTKNNDRMEWLIEKATEIGLDEFTPLLCRFSERRHIQQNRLEKVAIAAMKQSLKAYLPVIHEMADFSEILTSDFTGERYIAHCRPGDKPHLMNLVPANTPVLVLIGPEGDFSPEEVEQARQLGLTEVTLGRSRLRTETAALAACHIVSLCNI